MPLFERPCANMEQSQLNLYSVTKKISPSFVYKLFNFCIGTLLVSLRMLWQLSCLSKNNKIAIIVAFLQLHLLTKFLAVFCLVSEIKKTILNLYGNMIKNSHNALEN